MRKERYEQENLVSWFAWQYPKFELLLQASLNGAHLNDAPVKPGMSAKVSRAIRWRALKKQGAVDGAADLFLAIARGGFHGLYVEMKRADGGTHSKKQKEFQDAVEAQGYMYAVCPGFDAAKSVIENYINQ